MGNPVFSIEGPSFDVFDLATNSCHFALCRNSPAVSTVDVRMGIIETITLTVDPLKTLSFAGQVRGSVLAVGTNRGLCLFDSEQRRSAVEITEVNGVNLGGIRKCAIDPLKLRVPLLIHNNEILNLIGDL
jgi:hypothetical protein